MAKHTPGKLEVYAMNIYSPDNGNVCQMSKPRPKSGLIEHVPLVVGDDQWDEAAANARRLAAAWNACEGISTEALEAGAVAGLVAACEEIDNLAQEIYGWYQGDEIEQRLVRKNALLITEFIKSALAAERID